MADPSTWIDLVLLRAQELRAAGVLSIGFDNQTATFLEMPIVHGGAIDRPDDDIDTPNDPLNDPATYVGGVVPGYQIRRLTPDEEF